MMGQTLMCSLALVTLAMVSTYTESFSMPTRHNHHHHHHQSLQQHHVMCDTTYRIQSTTLHQSFSPEENESRKSRISKESENFLEQSSQNGYDKIKQMSIEERTRRAMLAEAAEDRIVMLSDELDKLLGDDGMPLTVEDREEVTFLATQIKASREQYQTLVNGGESSSLEMFNMSSSSTKDDNDMDLQ